MTKPEAAAPLPALPSLENYQDDLMAAMNEERWKDATFLLIAKVDRLYREAAAPLPAPLEQRMRNWIAAAKDRNSWRGLPALPVELMEEAVDYLDNSETHNVLLQNEIKQLKASACVAQPPEPSKTYEQRTEESFGVLQRLFGIDAIGDDPTDFFVIAEQKFAELASLTVFIARSSEPHDDDFPDAVMRVGYQAQVDALAPELKELRTQLAVSAAERAGEADAYRIQGEELLRHIRLAEDAEAKLAALEPYLRHLDTCPQSGALHIAEGPCACGLDTLRLSGQQL